MSRLSREDKIQAFHDYEDYPAFRWILAKELCEECSSQCIFHIYCALALNELVRYEEAEECLDKAEAICSQDQQFLIFIQKGHLFKKRKYYEKSAMWYQKAVDLDSTDSGFHVFLGSVLARMGNLDEAEKCHRTAVECIKGDIDEAYLNLGYILRAKERFEESAECFDKALQIDPDYELAQLAKQDVLKAMLLLEDNNSVKSHSKIDRLHAILEADDDIASELLMARKLIEDYPDYCNAYIQYARILTDISRFKEASEEIGKAIEYCPADKLYYPYLRNGHLYEQKGDYSLAIEWFNKCIELEPDDADFHIRLGEILFQQEKLSEAQHCFEYAIKCQKGTIKEGYLNLGLILRSQELFEEAEECFMKSLELDSEYNEANIALEDIRKAKDYLR